jgi:hypothetical protein
MSLLHFVTLCVAGSVIKMGTAAESVLYVLMMFPVHLSEKLGLLELVSDPNRLLAVLTVLNSLLYGAGLTAIYLMIRRVLKR